MDTITDSDSVDMGSIPVRDGMKNRLHTSVVRLQSVILLKGCFMKIHGVQRIWRRPFWVHLKKHYCPVCMNLLTTTKVSKVVNSKSEEDKKLLKFDFRGRHLYMAGNIKVVWTEFMCNDCCKTYSLDEIRESEKKKNEE